MCQRYRKRTRETDIMEVREEESWMGGWMQVGEEHCDRCYWEHFLSVDIKVVTFSVNYLQRCCQWTQPPGRTSAAAVEEDDNWKEAVGGTETLAGFSWLINNWEAAQPFRHTYVVLCCLVTSTHPHLSLFTCYFSPQQFFSNYSWLRGEWCFSPKSIVDPSFCKMQLK